MKQENMIKIPSEVFTLKYNYLYSALNKLEWIFEQDEHVIDS